MKERYDLVVVGAGPAGLGAAALGARLGLATLLVDEQATPGGQIYRNVEDSPFADRRTLGPEYHAGARLVEALRKGAVDYAPRATVWQVTPEREVGVARDGAARVVRAGQVVLAAGALERPFPIPGWTLPGVMTAGAAQALLKANAVGVHDAVFAGSGPLLYLAACQYARLGLPVQAVLDTTPLGNYVRAAPRAPRAAFAGAYVAKGVAMITELGRRGVRLVRGVGRLEALGDGRVEAVAYHAGVDRGTIAAAALFLHQGVAPDVNLALAAGCEHGWDDGQLCWRPRTDAWGETTVPGIAVAGDGGGIGGARAAEFQGRLAAIGAAWRLGEMTAGERDRLATKIQRALATERRLRPFLETLYRPRRRFRVPERDDVVVCRCEEVTAGALRDALALGCPGVNQLKSFTRCGMGPCQGRMCGLTACELMAAERGVSPAAVGYFRPRPPAKPVALGALAQLPDADARVYAPCSPVGKKIPRPPLD